MTARIRAIGRRTILGVTALLLFLTLSMGPLSQVADAACAAPPIAFGRWRWCGYWQNTFDNSGDSVRIGGVPAAVNTAEEFINLLSSDLASGNANRITGASFVIQTMIGSPLPTQGFGSPATPRPPSAAQFAEFAKRVRGYANYSTFGNNQYGTNGSVEWWGRQHITCGTYNTYWQGNFGGGPNPDDVAPYIHDASNSDCEIPSSMDDVIVFRDEAGNEVYKIRRNCMNPLGVLRELSNRDPVDFTLDPGIGMVIRDNGNVIPGTVAEVGDQVTFTYRVHNSGPTASREANCSVRGRNYPGYQNVSSTGSIGGSPVAGVSPGCPRVFNVGNTDLATEVINLDSSQANQTLCRQVEVSPQSETNLTAAREVACVKVANKPYISVTHGDVSVGNGFATASEPNSCSATSNNRASAIGWNRRTANNYSGAGTRHAVYALEAIFDYATAQGSTGAAVPQGLAFANTSTSVTNGAFGGRLGSVPCIPDYFGQRPAANQAWKNNVSAMSDANGGIYHSDTSQVLNGGVINPNSNVSVYINGDLHITSNITYPNNFNLNSMPLFQVVVRGNIYIESDVSQLDGIYVAQPNGGSGGTIYTCANTTPYTVPARTASNFYSACNNQLTVNGVFSARQISLMRTHGSLKTSNVGEVFNYSPAFWLQQPRGGGSGSTYDSITSLPPIL